MATKYKKDDVDQDTSIRGQLRKRGVKPTYNEEKLPKGGDVVAPPGSDLAEASNDVSDQVVNSMKKRKRGGMKALKTVDSLPPMAKGSVPLTQDERSPDLAFNEDLFASTDIPHELKLKLQALFQSADPRNPDSIQSYHKGLYDSGLQGTLKDKLANMRTYGAPMARQNMRRAPIPQPIPAPPGGGTPGAPGGAGPSGPPGTAGYTVGSYPGGLTPMGGNGGGGGFPQAMPPDLQAMLQGGGKQPPQPGGYPMPPQGAPPQKPGGYPMPPQGAPQKPGMYPQPPQGGGFPQMSSGPSQGNRPQLPPELLQLLAQLTQGR